MKKIFILAAGLFIAGAANAQSPVRFGVKAGVNIANIIKDDGNNNFDTEGKVGFNAGVTADIPLTQSVSFTPEVLFSQKGYKQTGNNFEFSRTTNFIDIPILASVRLASTLDLVVGPQVSFLMSTKNKLESGSTTIETSYDNESDNFKKSLLGGVIGARYGITENIDIHGRYALDFQKNNENGTANTPEFKNQVWSFGLGYKF
jgi:opacity protein-like surface antigen